MVIYNVLIRLSSCDFRNICYFYNPKRLENTVVKKYGSLDDARSFFLKLRQHIKSNEKYDNYTDLGEREFLSYITGTDIDRMITVKLYEERIDLCSPDEDACLELDKLLETQP